MRARAPGTDAAVHLAAQQRVARELVRAVSLEEAGPGVLAAIGEALGWDLAGLWEVRVEGPELRMVAGWERTPGGAEEFWQLSRQLRFGMGEGVPGRAWAAGEPFWRVDLGGDPTYPRGEAALAVGMRVALAVPAPIGAPGDVVAVMDFFSRHPEPPDTLMREMLASFGDQLAQFEVRRRAEEAVRRSEALKTAIVESSLDCVITMDHTGKITAFNAAAEATFGYHRWDVIGRDLADLIIPPAFRERHREGLRRYLRTGSAPMLGQRVELPGLRADGSEVPLELSIVALPGADPPLFTGFLRELAERQEAEEARRHLAAIVASTDDAVGSIDLNGVITSWNPGAERLYGYSAEEVVGGRMNMLVPDDRRHETAMLLERLRQGEAIEGLETERLRADGSRISVSLTLSPITDVAGHITGVSIVGRDITARRRAEAAKEFLAVASAALDASLDPDETLRTIVRTAIPDLAELCIIDLFEEDGSIGRAVAAARDPDVARGIEDIRRRFPLDAGGRHPVAEVLRTGQPVVLRDLANPEVAAQVAQSDEHLEFMRRVGYRSAAVVALAARGRMLGALSFLQVRNDRRYGSADLVVLQDLGNRAAMAFDNARLYAERTRVAGMLQQGLLPRALPEPPGAEVAAAYRPAGEGAEVGGDFYDAFESGGGWGLAVGDVCGKGADAAALTSLVRYSTRAFALEHESPSHVLSMVNAAMLRDDRGGRFATAALVQLEPSARPATARLAVAGHPAPVVVRSGGETFAVDARGTLLGVEPELNIHDAEVELDTGDVVVLYTDGVLEAGAPASMLTPEDVAEALRPAAGESAEDVVRRVTDLAAAQADGRLRDDVAVLAVRLT